MEKINVVELLKDCPKGMELDCTIFEDVHFDCIDDVSDIINCYIQDSKHKIGISFSKYGCYSNISKSKCVIFPKGKTTWEGFIPPCKFKDGDIVAYDSEVGVELFIFKEYVGNTTAVCYLFLNSNTELYINETVYLINRLATEEEKTKLFQAIKDNGYKWDAETKVLEKLPTNKFDINTLVPFESKVLARDNEREKWIPAFWGFHDVNSDYPYKLIGCIARYCIPYEGNEHLLSTTNDCDEFYKTW